jgi:hypothetical protein
MPFFLTLIFSFTEKYSNGGIFFFWDVEMCFLVFAGKQLSLLFLLTGEICLVRW